jgi:hypothetical protein
MSGTVWTVSFPGLRGDFMLKLKAISIACQLHRFGAGIVDDGLAFYQPLHAFWSCIGQ